MRESTLLVTAAVAPLLAEPRAASEQVSQRPAGRRFEMLEVRSPWYRVRGEDGYEGWTHSGYVRVLSAKEAATRYRTGRVSLGCVIRDRDARRRPFPLGAILADDARVEEGEALTPAEVVERFPRVAEAVAASARDLFEGTPYQWGGVTPWGADCSGLVQSCFALHGVSLPRDAWQQATGGKDAGADLDALRAADLLFFSEKEGAKISHVALTLGPRRIVHLALGRGGFAVEDLDVSDDPYIVGLISRFRFARRML
ncbi:MAG: SH3 domain-containing C40 family peptidase [Gemmatimonadaceae bacterium]